VSAPDADFAAALLGSLRAGLAAIDGEGRLRVLNEPARRILRPGDPAPPAALLGRPVREVFSRVPVVAELLLSARTGGEAPSRAELALEAEAGEPARTIGFTLESVRDGGGRVCGAAMLFRDLRPLERMDEQERLRDRLAALGQMAAGLAHEIRNPLASLGVLAGLLRRRLAAGGEERGLVDELLAEIRTLEATVTDALDFVKPSRPARGALDLADALEAALAQVRARLPFEGVVERDYEDPPPRASGDPEQIRAALANLVANALEAMRGADARGRLLLRAVRRAVGAGEGVLRVAAGGPVPRAAARAEAVVEVADSGPGVAPELRERVFYPFFTTKERGSGLGLALAHKAVASSGGSIEVDGSRFGGALFRVRLPLAEGAP
jgi:signal transduction histidine kinase